MNRHRSKPRRKSKRSSETPKRKVNLKLKTLVILMGVVGWLRSFANGILMLVILDTLAVTVAIGSGS